MPTVNLFVEERDRVRWCPITEGGSSEKPAVLKNNCTGALRRISLRCRFPAFNDRAVICAVAELYRGSLRSHSYDWQSIQRYRPNQLNTQYIVTPNIKEVFHCLQSRQTDLDWWGERHRFHAWCLKSNRIRADIQYNCTRDGLQIVQRPVLLRGTGCDEVNISPYWSRNEECFLQLLVCPPRRTRYVWYNSGNCKRKVFYISKVIVVAGTIANFRIQSSTHSQYQ